MVQRLIFQKILYLVLTSIFLIGCGGQIPSDKKFTGPNQNYSTDDLYRFFAVAFGAAPGVTYGLQLLEAAEAGMSLKDIVNVFTTKSQFTDTYPATLNHQEFAAKLVANVVGSSATDGAKQEAINDIVSALSLPGWTRGDVIYAVFNNLANKPASDAHWYATSQKLANQVVVAKYFTEVMRGDTTDLQTLKNVIAYVDEKIVATEDLKKTISKYIAIEVYKDSYSNKNLIYTDAVQLPSLRILKNDFGFEPSAEELGSGCTGVGCLGNGVVNDRSLAFGDFLQDGSYTAFMTTWRKTGVHDSYLINRPIVDAKSRAYFLKRENGRWVDKTAQLLPNPDDRLTCVSHSYTNVADFNADGKPDLLVSCHGIDYSFGPGDTVSGLGVQDLFPTTWREILFDEQIVYLSQTDGTYKKTTIPGRLYGHHSSAADINGDGKIDIITTNVSWGNANSYEDLRPFFLINNGDGTFVRDYTRLPVDMIDPSSPNSVVGPVTEMINIYWTYLIPIEGRIDLVLVGKKTAWYKNPGNGNFSNVTPTFLPLTNSYEASPLDMTYRAGYFYINHSGGSWPGTMRVKKINAITLSVETIYTLNQALGSGEGPISPQFKFSTDGTSLVPFVAGCERDALATNFNTSKCGIRIPL